MATGASNCNLSILLIDARKGMLDQTIRHSFISSLLGIRNLIIAINKMDLVEFSQKVFESICYEYLFLLDKFPKNLNIFFVPMSALKGDNIVSITTQMIWYKGPTILDILEKVKVINLDESRSMRFPIQYVNRPTQNFRGYSGTIASGVIKSNQKIKILPYNVISNVQCIINFNGYLSESWEGEAVTIILSDELDISRGDLITNINENLLSVKKVFVHLVWMTEKKLRVNQIFDIKISYKKTRVKINNILYQVDLSVLERYKKIFYH